MEHSAEKIIREKILDTEQTDVSWNKEWVWSRIETPPQKRKFIFWYSAAAIVVAAISVSVYWYSLSNEHILMAQLDRLESAIEQLTFPNNLVSETVEQVCAEELPVLISKVPVDRAFVKNESIPNQITEADKSIAGPMLQPIDAIPLTIAVSIEEPSLILTEPERMIKPIVGKIPESQPAVAAAKTKDLKIRVFQARNTQENSVVDNREYKLLTARFNNN